MSHLRSHIMRRFKQQIGKKGKKTHANLSFLQALEGSVSQITSEGEKNLFQTMVPHFININLTF
jgi:hypothetical protein